MTIIHSLFCSCYRWNVRLRVPNDLTRPGHLVSTVNHGWVPLLMIYHWHLHIWLVETWLTILRLLSTLMVATPFLWLLYRNKDGVVHKTLCLPVPSAKANCHGGLLLSCVSCKAKSKRKKTNWVKLGFYKFWTAPWTSQRYSSLYPNVSIWL